MARMMRPRLISQEQAKRVAGAGGVIGVWTHLADSPLAYAQNIRALVDVVGIDHVCLGTDTKLTPPYRPAGGGGPKPGTGGPSGGPSPQPAGPPSAKSAATPGNAPRGRVGERTNEVWAGQQVGFYYAVVGAMLQVGFTKEEIGQVSGGNFCRVFGTATAG